MRKMLLIIVVMFILTTIQTANAQSNQGVLINSWALGVDNSVGCVASFTPELFEGWQYNQYISWSKCPKNPAPPDGQSSGGAAFKNGSRFGNGVPGEIASIWQNFSLTGQAESYTVNFNVHAVCGRCEYIKFTIYGSNDGGQNWDNLGELLTIDSNTQACGPSGGRGYAQFCAEPTTVMHYDLYRLQVDSLFLSGPGAKWTGLKLYFD